MVPKAPPKFTSPAKPPESSTMTRDEIEEIYHQMEKRITENREQMEKKIIENKEEIKRNMDENKNHIKKKMGENKEEKQNSMKEMKTSMSSMIFQALDERLLKGDIKMQGTHENKGSIKVEQPTNNTIFSSGFNSNSGVNYGWGPNSVNFPKV